MQGDYTKIHKSYQGCIQIGRQRKIKVYTMKTLDINKWIDKMQTVVIIDTLIANL